MQRVRVLFLFIFMVYFYVGILSIGLYMIQSSKYALVYDNNSFITITEFKQTQHQNRVSILCQMD